MDINNEDFQKFLKWCDEQVKHFESLDKAENNSTRYWAGRVDSISACKIYVSALQPSPLPLIECPDIEELIEKCLPNQIDLSSFKPKEVLFIKSAWQHGAIVMFHQLKNMAEDSKSVPLFDKEDPEGLWGFFYNPCIHESASAMISLHWTKEGAEKAMAFLREEKRKEWEKMWSGEDEDMREDMPFGNMESWFINAVKVEN